ncbi:hypothetical protein F383_35661 [Gossypium arboreum]|uniref:Uncharacterized protein n=1 Tax=Gossypium arboreum TaxID=29729 RepID=A0A0B0PX17_GOSAR|nr:hypothetical protein F383_35661 [Gossypium arboreum]
MDQHVKSTRPGLLYTGKPHARVVLNQAGITQIDHTPVSI